MIRNIKNMVENSKKATFVRYANGSLIYKTECGFEFPVPIEDLGNSTINNEEKALILMRYIRKHIENEQII
ncbi:TPA: hypothetical protein NV714_004774 [Escherichia coli]|jgi:hypothetical protein|nr:hypothetical protein [Escherichia coli]